MKRSSRNNVHRCQRFAYFYGIPHRFFNSQSWHYGAFTLHSFLVSHPKESRDLRTCQRDTPRRSAICDATRRASPLSSLISAEMNLALNRFRDLPSKSCPTCRRRSRRLYRVESFYWRPKLAAKLHAFHLNTSRPETRKIKFFQ